MSRLINSSIALACIVVLAGIFFVSQAETVANYYSNSFDSPSSLNDGYWQAKNTQIQTINGTNVLEINGEASFNPQHGDYLLNNFTVQFDVYHNVVYENNTAYSGPFYQGADSENRTILLMGYIQRETSEGNQVEIHQEGFLTDLLTYNHYYFLFNRSSEWSTWRLTGNIAQVNGVEGFYRANFTIQVDNETITSFRSDSILPEGTVHNIINEEVRPIAYHNLYPLPQTGVMIIPTTSTNNGLHYNLLSNKATTVQYNQATPSYIDNFLYGYADAVPMSLTSPTSSPIPSISPSPSPTPTVPEFSSIIILTLLITAIALTMLVCFKKRNGSSVPSRPALKAAGTPL
jgi:hypothetical protein